MSERHEPGGVAQRDAAGAPTGGQLNAGLARAVVRVHNRYRGRGPTKVQAFFRHHVIVVLMQDTMTQAERSLIEDGKPDVVLQVRKEIQGTMRPKMVSSVEALTGRRVIAFMSTNHVDPDLAAELFVLDGPVNGRDLARDPAPN